MPRRSLGIGTVIDFHGTIRVSTRADHERVDALFGAYNLSSPRDYGAMLMAHGRALLPIEDWMAADAVPGWEPRGDALRDDLRALGLTPPALEALHWPADEAALWGTAYVLEGSRLGGAMIARQVGAGLPRAYLGAVHRPGDWRAFLAALDEKARAGGARWQTEAIAAAQRVFERFARAAQRDATAGERQDRDAA